MTTYREHATNGEPCWCDPAVMMPCDECEDHENPSRDCWVCHGRGLVEWDGDPDEHKVIVHREITFDD